MDGAGLRGFFDGLICGPDTRSLIEQGHLSRYRLFGPTIPDLRGVRVRMGDYAKGDVEEVMNRPVLVGDAIEHYQRHAAGSRAVVFACSVRASEAVAERFCAAGIPAKHVDGKTPYRERDQAVKDLRTGRIKVLSNVDLFTEGFDLPAIDAVILLRPTKSLALYRQMVGRGLRPAPGKVETIILDHAGCVHEHGLPDDEIAWTLDGHRLPVQAGKTEGRPRLRRCPECSAIHEWSAECAECGHLYGVADRTLAEVYGELREVRGISGNQHPKGYPPGTFECRADFAVRVGKHRSRINKWAAAGLPCGPNGWVDIKAGVAWIKATAEQRAARIFALGSGQKAEMKSTLWLGLTTTQCAEIFGVTVNVVEGWKRRGAPKLSDGTLDEGDLRCWLKSVKQRTNSVPGFETLRAFARRIGVSETGGKRSMVRRGLPVAANGLVEIEAGLSWVKQHGVIRRQGGVSRVEEVD